jgi:hypothetical protein
MVLHNTELSPLLPIITIGLRVKNKRVPIANIRLHLYYIEDNNGVMISDSDQFITSKGGRIRCIKRLNS